MDCKKGREDVRQLDKAKLLVVSLELQENTLDAATVCKMFLCTQRAFANFSDYREETWSPLEAEGWRKPTKVHISLDRKLYNNLILFRSHFPLNFFFTWNIFFWGGIFLILFCNNAEGPKVCKVEQKLKSNLLHHAC